MKMADVSKKDVTYRIAIARGIVSMGKGTIEAIKNGAVPKGDVLTTAKIAGIMAAKKTPELLPLCHPIQIENVNVELVVKSDSIEIKSSVSASAKTGVEMEALTSVAVTALTIYDMCKPLDKNIVISEIVLLEKRGGKSGTYIRR